MTPSEKTVRQIVDEIIRLSENLSDDRKTRQDFNVVTKKLFSRITDWLKHTEYTYGSLQFGMRKQKKFYFEIKINPNSIYTKTWAYIKYLKECEKELERLENLDNPTTTEKKKVYGMLKRIIVYKYRIKYVWNHRNHVYITRGKVFDLFRKYRPLPKDYVSPLINKK